MAKKRKNITAKRVQAGEDKPFTLPNVEARRDVDDDGWGDDGLTVRQRGFVEALVGPAGGNQSRAAEMAGYAAENRNSLRATASYLLTLPNVQEAVARALTRRKMTPDWARQALVDLASSSMANFVSVDAEGEATLDFAKAAAAGALGQIKEYREEGLKTGDGVAHIIKRTVKVHDRTAALGMLLKLHGLLKDDQPQKTDNEVQIRPKSGGTVRPKPNAPDAGRKS